MAVSWWLKRMLHSWKVCTVDGIISDSKGTHLLLLHRRENPMMYLMMYPMMFRVTVTSLEELAVVWIEMTSERVLLQAGLAAIGMQTLSKCLQTCMCSQRNPESLIHQFTCWRLTRLRVQCHTWYKGGKVQFPS